ncbi:hypothetical protein K493DRAFT_323800 [Basidiobolus meristosporus CBS 931.73]|uniref:Uncharacterized protein n=1 Tax=Basidiobolus meristosporus CBS 931.73 TaxID=1314790 RepID=A0A1Y1YQ08_9FUNG|nr:hypothetical protein K493DRAFT_323800 [Basidiobolus meristosporus CBS 931.73]|eukprot:ORX99836.1 hypothetical protein K493DRAFT_323800 [Basidiobolus meristosporus CBS 931.73]
MALEVHPQTPEFVQLLGDLKSTIQEVKKQVNPLQAKITSNELAVDKGVSFLDVKYHILLQYLTDIAFFIYLKLEGKSIENHAVVDDLIQLRVILEKMKPVEQKLKYQIDKLVRAATIGIEGLNEEAGKGSVSDPFAFKPNPQNLVDKNAKTKEDEEEAAASGIYKAPKLAPVHFDEGSTAKSKQDREQARLLQRASKSRMMQDLIAEYDDRPEEVNAYSGINEGIGISNEEDRKMREREAYEEENFIRMTLSKKEMKKIRKGGVKRFEDEFEHLNDFTNLAAIQAVEEQEKNSLSLLKRKKTRQQLRDDDDNDEDEYSGPSQV